MYNPHLIHFIQALSSVEIRLVEEYLIKSRSQHENDKEEGMELKLLKFLIAKKGESVTDEMIVTETSTKRVTDLKNNLFHKVLEALTLDKYISNTSVFNENEIVFFYLKKKLLACRISIRVVNKGKTEAIDEILNEVILKAKEFEIYEILTEALHVQKYFRGIRAGLQEFEKTNKELEFYEYCQKASNKANDNYYKLILNNEFIKTFSAEEVNDHLTSSIKEMELDYKKTKSEQINYYLHIMRFAFDERKKDYPKAIAHCNQLISLLSKNKVIYKAERMGFAYTNLSQYKTFAGKYSESIKDAKKSQTYYLENSFNYAVSKEQEFYANFYDGNYSAGNRCLIELLNHPTVDTGQFRKSKFIYYQACTLFAEQKFQPALRLLNEALEIEKDKSRWNISLRILNIMIFIEMNKINEASTALEALRKHISRTGKTDEVSERDDLIVRTLREMEKDGFQYDPKNSNMAKLFKQLTEKDSRTSWEHYSSELIKFHEWLEGKKK